MLARPLPAPEHTRDLVPVSSRRRLNPSHAHSTKFTLSHTTLRCHRGPVGALRRIVYVIRARAAGVWRLEGRAVAAVRDGGLRPEGGRRRRCGPRTWRDAPPLDGAGRHICRLPPLPRRGPPAPHPRTRARSKMEKIFERISLDAVFYEFMCFGCE